MLDEGRYASITEMAAAERIERGYLGSLLRLTLLAPDIVEAVLDGRQPEGMQLPLLMEPLQTAWADQRKHAGRQQDFRAARQTNSAICLRHSGG